MCETSSQAILPSRNVPATFASLTLHLVFLLAVVLLLPSTNPTPTFEPDRSVSIVLASPGNDTRRDYHRPNESTAADSTSTSSRRNRSTLDAALPNTTAADLLVLPDAALPTTNAGRLPAAMRGDRSLTLPSLTGGGRRPILPGLGDDEILASDPLRNGKKNTGPTGPTARVAPFGVVGEGRSFVFVIDRSKSMGGQGLGAIAAAERELNRELAKLLPVHRFQIIAYNQRLSYFSFDGLLSATDENKRLASNFLAHVVAVGATEHEPALLAALRLMPDVVYLLSDGGDPLLRDDQLRILTRANAGTTAIHCLRFHHGTATDDDHFMRRLARLNSGTYTRIDMSRHP